VRYSGRMPVQRTGTAVVVLFVLVAYGLPAVAAHADRPQPSRVCFAFAVSEPAHSDTSGAARLATGAADLARIADRMPPLSESTRLRRKVADATFCLPQNILGVLYYAFLQLTGSVLDVADAAEAKIIVTKTPFGASLGKYIFVSKPLLSEGTIRHEYGHVMQGYKRGPFYLLFEGTTSFAQAILSLASPSFARGYFNRWPENEAERLGAIAWPPSDS
jgi:hypothetical protein